MRQMFSVVLGMALVAVGGMAYLLFRSASLLIYQMACSLGLGPLLAEWRTHTLQWQWPEWVVYCLPDGFWAAGYVLVVSGLFRPHPLKWAVAGIVPLAGCLSEVAQWAGLLPGTPDVVDAVCYLIPYILYLSVRSWKTEI